MTLDLHSLAGVLIPFAGTSLGAAGVLFLKRDLRFSYNLSYKIDTLDNH